MLEPIRDFREGDSRYGPPKAVPYRGGGGGSEGILPRKTLKIKVLGNVISGILRPSQRVTMSHTEVPELPPLDPPQ